MTHANDSDTRACPGGKEWVLMWDNVRPWFGQNFDAEDFDDGFDDTAALRPAGHIIVSGDDALATTIVDELNKAGATIVKLSIADLTAARLVDAGIDRAMAVVCAGADDAVNLEIALLARKINADVRVVARLDNDVVREAMTDNNGPGAILGVADLAAPSVVEAALASTTHSFQAAGVEFAVWATEARNDASLREMYGDLAPVAIIKGENSATPGQVVPCPGRASRVQAGDWTAVIGTADQLTARGVRVSRPTETRSPHRRLRGMLDAARSARDDVNPAFFPATAIGLMLLVGSTILLRFNFQHQPSGMSWLDALYFSAETITTVGFGDFNFADQPTWLRMFSVALMFVGMTTTALQVAFLADLLLSRRFVQTSGRRRARHLRDHVVVVGLGSLGMRVVADLTAAGHDVAVIELDDDNPFLSSAAELDVPVIFGDATLRQTLESACVDRARAVAMLTHDDMVNIETGIVLSEMFDTDAAPTPDRAEVPLVLRVYDRDLGFAVAQRFGFEHVRSTVELAAPWFIGAAMGLRVLDTFSVGQSSFMVGAMHVEAGSELDGLHIFEMPAQTRVIAITRPDTTVTVHPRSSALLQAGDTAYLVGPYRELLDTLRTRQRPTWATARTQAAVS
jgi:Trk K+ transport system NAD-binding subunit